MMLLRMDALVFSVVLMFAAGLGGLCACATARGLELALWMTYACVMLSLGTVAMSGGRPDDVTDVVAAVGLASGWTALARRRGWLG